MGILANLWAILSGKRRAERDLEMRQELEAARQRMSSEWLFPVTVDLREPKELDDADWERLSKKIAENNLAARRATTIQPSMPAAFSRTVKRDVTPLMEAAYEGREAVVRELLADGAEVDARTDGGSTALMFAAQCGELTSVELLLDAGASVRARDSNGETALIRAATEGRLDVVKTLLTRSSDPNAKGDAGNTALMQAACYGHLEVATALVAAGSSIDDQNVDGTTALFFSVVSGDLRVVKLLLSKHADPNLRMSDGFTPLMRAEQDERNDIVTELVRYGASTHP